MYSQTEASTDLIVMQLYWKVRGMKGKKLWAVLETETLSIITGSGYSLSKMYKLRNHLCILFNYCGSVELYDCSQIPRNNPRDVFSPTLGHVPFSTSWRWRIFPCPIIWLATRLGWASGIWVICQFCSNVKGAAYVCHLLPFSLCHDNGMPK